MDRRVADSPDPRQRQSLAWRARRRRNRALNTGRGGRRSIRPLAARVFRARPHESISGSSICSAPAFAALRASASNGDSNPRRPMPIQRSGGIERPDRIRCRRTDAARIDSATMLAAMRDALVRRGVAVAETDGFQSYDLEIVVPPTIRAPINALRERRPASLCCWRTRIAPRRALIAAAITLLVLLAAGFSLRRDNRRIVACAAIAAGLARDQSRADASPRSSRPALAK